MASSCFVMSMPYITSNYGVKHSNLSLNSKKRSSREITRHPFEMDATNISR